MKKFFSVTARLFLSAAVLMELSSCLKDKAFDEGKVQSPANQYNMFKAIEIGLTATDNTKFLAIALEATNTDTTFNLIPVNLASSEPAQEDINVTLVKNDALVAAYNSAHGTAYVVPSPTLYTIVNANNVVTIPKGSYTGYLKIKFKPAGFLGNDYALGYSIGSVDKQGYTISGNLNSGVIAIAIKNKYDGDYHSNGYFYHPASPRAISNLAKSVLTVNATTSKTKLGDLANDIYLTVDPATNKVTVSDAGAPPGTTPTAALSSLPGGYTPFNSTPSLYNNTYDPNTRTFYLRYGYQGASGWRVAEEILKHD